MKTLALAAGFLAVSTMAASATICSDGTKKPFFSDSQRAQTERECKQKHGGVYAICYTGRGCTIVGRLKPGVKVKLCGKNPC